MSLPVLDGHPGEIHFREDDAMCARVALALLDAGLADPADWHTSGRVPAAFLERTLARWIGPTRRRAIHKRLDMVASFRSGLVAEEYRHEGDAPLYLTTEAVSYNRIFIGEAVDLLADAHARYPVTWWRLFSTLQRCICIFDFGDMDWYLEIIRTERVAYREAAVDGEREMPADMTLKDIVPGPLLDGKPLTPRGLRRVMTLRARSAGDGRAEQIMTAALDMAEAAGRAKSDPWPGAADDEYLIDDWEHPVPAIAVAIEPHDECAAAMDMYAEQAGQVSGYFAPSFWIKLDLERPETLHAAYMALDASCDALVHLSRMMDLMPGNEQTLVETLGADEEGGPDIERFTPSEVRA